MDISGELVNNYIIIKKARDIGRLYNKSHMGTLQKSGSLQLNLLEGLLLLDENKMILFQNKKQVNLSQLLKLAIQQIPDFETKYLVFKNLRNRGHAITLIDDDAHISFRKLKTEETTLTSCAIATFSERDTLDIDQIQRYIRKFTKKNNALWFALVDEEGDLTYYDVSEITLKGDISEQKYPAGQCILLKNRLIVFDKKLSGLLLQKEFFGKPFGELLQISFVEAIYLLEKGVLEIRTSDGKHLSKQKCLYLMQEHQPDIQQRLLVFKDLKQRGLLVKTGFKFGAHFRAYTKQPHQTHAEYLIHVVEKGFTSIWSDISRAVRLAHSVNKEFVFACVDGASVSYIKLGRLRP
ncbi:MAG: tRNA-intron lyase [Thermoplasmata archaeon M9B2D]|nr:MAG: tRNA-intron lyase [Thermoplasmata archaeon M9B2D]